MMNLELTSNLSEDIVSNLRRITIYTFDNIAWKILSIY